MSRTTAGTVISHWYKLAAMALAVLLVAASPGLSAQQACEDRDQDGYFATDGCGSTRDCNDDDAVIFPGAGELCDGQDGDCNGFVDDSPSCDRTCDNPEKMPADVQLSDAAAHSQWGNVVWVGDGWVVAYQTEWDTPCITLYLRKLDAKGTPAGGPVIVAGGEGVHVSPREPWVVWTGSEVGVGWHEAPTDSTCFGLAGDFHPYFRRYGANLIPLGGPIQLGCAQFDSEANARPAWGGHQYGLAWGRGGLDRGLRFTTLSRDGVATDPCGLLVAPPNHPNPDAGPTNHSLVWNGNYFGLSWSDARPDADFLNIFDDIYFRRIAEDSSLPDLAPVQVTDEPKRSQWTSLAWADGEWAVSWADGRTNPWDIWEVFVARLQPVGTKIDPPGDIQVTCCSTNVTDPQRFFNRLVWTGEEFGLGYRENNHEFLITGDVFLQRVDRLGNKIGSAILITPDATKDANHVDVAWNGKKYGLTWDNKVGQFQQVFFGRVGCNCTDADADTFTTCAGDDCNDQDALINSSASEACLDGADNNCDAMTDCQDTATCPAQGGPIPGEVTGLVLGADKQTLSWQPESRSDVYDILTGDIGELRVDGNFGRSRCLAWRVPSAFYADTMPPNRGKGFYYLVRGKKDRCKLGTWGSALRDQAKLTCP